MFGGALCVVFAAAAFTPGLALALALAAAGVVVSRTLPGSSDTHDPECLPRLSGVGTCLLAGALAALAPLFARPLGRFAGRLTPACAVPGRRWTGRPPGGRTKVWHPGELALC